MARGRKRTNKLGNTYGSFKVVDCADDIIDKRCSVVAWKCECVSCGKIKITRSDNLIIGRQNECNSFYCRFYSSVRKTKHCWEWTGGLNRATGYGKIRIEAPSRLIVSSHRASWIIHFGDIPEGMLILHHCDNRSCVNPSHLFLGSHKDNYHDMVNKGRACYQVNKIH